MPIPTQFNLTISNFQFLIEIDIINQENITLSKMESLQKEVERLKKENESMKLMLRVLSIKHSNSEENNIDSMNTNKRARTIQHLVETTPFNKTSYQVCVRTGFKDQTLIVDDGYQWKKYGQKITKDSQSPRAYFKCSTMGCPVKKKVQRSLEDKCVVIASYVGQHNHGPHFPISSSPITAATAHRSQTPTPAVAAVSTDLNLDLTLSGNREEKGRTSQILKEGLRDRDLNNIKAYAEILAKDPNFALALAAEVARSFNN